MDSFSQTVWGNVGHVRTTVLNAHCLNCSSRFRPGATTKASDLLCIEERLLAQPAVIKALEVEFHGECYEK